MAVGLALLMIPFLQPCSCAEAVGLSLGWEQLIRSPSLWPSEKVPKRAPAPDVTCCKHPLDSGVFSAGSWEAWPHPSWPLFIPEILGVSPV